MEKDILFVLKYFSYFDYSPTFDEIHRFFPKKISKKELQKEIKILVDKKLALELQKVISCKLQVIRYTLGEYSNKHKNSELRIMNYELKYKNSEKKIKKIQTYIKILSFFPQIQLMGLSGTVAMMNAEKDDDIDLFIITAPDRLWTGRFIAMFFAQLLGLRRKREERKTRDKVCLNLFFDGKALTIPKFKKTEYVAREILQMKPVINKGFIYEEFLQANIWVKKYFPNSLSSPRRRGSIEIKNYYMDSCFRRNDKIRNPQSAIMNFIYNGIENVLKTLQLISIKRHQTNEIITDTQLWFFPKDFEQEVINLSSKKPI